jgi:hypothetical protein
MRTRLDILPKSDRYVNQFVYNVVIQNFKPCHDLDKFIKYYFNY